MAEQTAAQARDGNQQKRPAETETTGYNTRNKNLRPIYNPDPPPPQKKTKRKPSKPQAAAGRPAHAIDVELADVQVPSTTAPHTSVSHYQQVNKHTSAGPNDVNLAMNDWIIGEVNQNKPSSNAFHLPTSTAEMPNDPSIEAQVQQVLLNTASHLAKGNQSNGFYPHRYVVRGPEQKKLGLNSLNILEYLHGILRMIKDKAVPSISKPYIYAHLEEIIEDAREFDWATAVRPWSEEIFTLIAEGQLPEGWASQQKIQMLRMATARASTAKLTATTTHSHSNKINNQTRPRQAPNTVENLRGGSPCVDYNSQRGCQLQSGHIVNGRKVVHICAFCLWYSASTFPHPECYCRNRQRHNTSTHFQ